MARDRAERAEPATWRELAVARSLDPARARAENRVQRFLDAAMQLMQDGEGNDFTVQEVVERSGQSLRSFYQYFDGKHELLLALFEEEMSETVARVREASTEGDPLERLEQAVLILYDVCSPERRSSIQPLFFEFAQLLLISHPDEVSRAYTPLFEYLVSIVEDAAEAGSLRPGKPRRQAAIVLQASTTTAGRSGGGTHPITGEEMWEFCLHAIAPDDVAAARSKRASRSKST